MLKPARSSSVARLALALLLAGVAASVWWRLRPAPVAAPSAVAGAAATASSGLPTAHASSEAREPHEEEQRLFRAAQDALKAGDTDAAFSLLYEQATKFPKGVLAPAREVTHARTLCQAGKKAEARAEAAAFVAQHPDSPLSQEARGVCASF